MKAYVFLFIFILSGCAAASGSETLVRTHPARPTLSPEGESKEMLFPGITRDDSDAPKSYEEYLQKQEAAKAHWIAAARYLESVFYEFGGEITMTEWHRGWLYFLAWKKVNDDNAFEQAIYRTDGNITRQVGPVIAVLENWDPWAFGEEYGKVRPEEYKITGGGVYFVFIDVNTILLTLRKDYYWDGELFAVMEMLEYKTIGFDDDLQTVEVSEPRPWPANFSGGKPLYYKGLIFQNSSYYRDYGDGRADLKIGYFTKYDFNSDRDEYADAYENWPRLKAFTTEGVPAGSFRVYADALAIDGEGTMYLLTSDYSQSNRYWSDYILTIFDFTKSGDKISIRNENAGIRYTHSFTATRHRGSESFVYNPADGEVYRAANNAVSRVLFNDDFGSTRSVLRLGRETGFEMYPHRDDAYLYNDFLIDENGYMFLTVYNNFHEKTTVQKFSPKVEE